MEKNLSAGQRDNVYLNIARKELKLKQNLVEGLTQATVQTNKAIEIMSQSMESVGKSIGDGLAMLATALGGMNSNNNIPGRPYSNNDYYYQQPYVTPTITHQFSPNPLHRGSQSGESGSNSSNSSFVTYENL